MMRGTRRLASHWLVMLVTAVALGLCVGPLSVRFASWSDRLQLAEAVQQANDELTAAQTARAQAQAVLDAETTDPGTNQGHEEWTALGLYRYILLNAQSNSPAYWDAQCAIDVLTSGKNSTGHSYPSFEGPVPDGESSATYADIYKNVNLASRKDPVSLDNFKTALDYIDDYNNCRAQENREEGYNLSTNVGLNCRMMAIACVQLDVSYDYINSGGHTGAYNVGENLSWGYSDPFEGWYDEEKADYKKGNYSNVGHYLNIVDGLPEGENYVTKATGFAIHTGAPTYRVAYGQVFHTTWGYASYDPSITYTTSSFRSQWFDTYYQQQLDAGMHGTDSTMHAQHVQALNDAKRRVTAAQAALQSAQAAYSNYVNLSSNSLVSIQVPNATYTGNPLTPSVTVSVDGETLVQNTDYTVSYGSNTNVGTGTVTVSGMGIWTGTATGSFTINPKSIASVTVTGVESKTYTGDELTQTITVTDGSKTLREGQDYTLSYASNVNAGTATITIAGKGNYGSSTSVTFAINPADLKNATISKIADQTHTGSALTPAPVVTMNGRTLKAGTDYEVDYRDNINEGTATVTVTGKGNYTGTASTTFKISAVVLKEQVITASDVSITMLQTGNVKASTSGDGKLSYQSANTGIAKVSATGAVTPVSAGTTTITITAAKTDTYQEATKVVSVTISKVAQTITASDVSVKVGETADINATTSGDGALSYVSANTSIASVDPAGTVHGVAAGTTTITVTAAATATYKQATATINAKVDKYAQTITARNVTVTMGDTAQIAASTSGDGSLSFDVSDASIATVDASGTVRPVSVGTTSVTIAATETATYAAATKVVRVTVVAVAPIEASWTRLFGNGRYDTMGAIVSTGFDSSDWAVVATGANFPDALVASSLAGMQNCPVVLTKTDKLSNQAKERLEKLHVKNAYIMGGASAVSANVESELKDMGIKITRVQGSNRQATSLAAADLLPSSYYVVIATGGGFADALSIGPWCYATATPILLTDKSGRLSKAQLSWLYESCTAWELVVVGGAKAVPDATVRAACDALYIDAEEDVTRLAGANRYATSAIVADWEISQGMDVSHIAVATGKDFPDALAGAALCGSRGSVLTLVSDKDVSAVEAALDGRGSEVTEGYILGGEGAVSSSIMEHCERLTQ